VTEVTSLVIEVTSLVIEVTSYVTEVTSFVTEVTSLVIEVTSFVIEITSYVIEAVSLVGLPHHPMCIYLGLLLEKSKGTYSLIKTLLLKSSPSVSTQSRNVGVRTT
jgi:hypothetical protein